jgi:hypothetical protein
LRRHRPGAQEDYEAGYQEFHGGLVAGV